ncbi:MAG TPA: D-alanyl-D-alanine carboxypeptidase/D-alanyl-D-alanine-endopeptidase [Longimicrobiales bacterium]
MRFASIAAALLATAAISATPLSAQHAGLPAQISSIVERAPNDRAHWGIEVVDAVTGAALIRHNGDRLFVPASTVKLVIAAAAAHYLLPDFRYVTTLETAGAVTDGVLHGDLVLRGTGDPTISGRYADGMLSIWNALADSLRARGIVRIAGSVVGDESHWDADHVRPDWEVYDLLWWYAAPAGALGFNDNAIDFSVGPGAVGSPAVITWRPETSFFTFVNRTTTVPAGGEATLDFTRLPGTDTIIAYGSIPAAAARRTEYFAVDDPARYAATVFRETLEREGIEVSRDSVRVIRGVSVVAPGTSPTAPSRSVLVEHRSVPLPQLIAPVLQTSQNWFAEQLLKTIAREIGGAGSWEKGLELERRFLIDIVGIDSTAFRLRDASGLSAGNLMTPHTLVQILTYVQSTPRLAPALDALPVAGARTGSLRSRLQDLSGRVRAKTGSISNVDSLAGFLTAASGRRVIFAIVANNTAQSSARIRSAIDDIARAIAAAY